MILLATLLATWTLATDCAPLAHCPRTTHYQFEVLRVSMVPGTCADGSSCLVAGVDRLSPSCVVSGTSLDCPSLAPGDAYLLHCLRACNAAGCSPCAETSW